MEYNLRTSVLSNINSDSLVRIIYSAWDIQQSLSALTFLLEDLDPKTRYNSIELRRLKCFEAAMVMGFSRPFETSRNYPALSLNTIGIKLNRSEVELKDKILGVRRRVVAHSDVDMMHFISTVLTIDGFEGVPFPHIQYDESLVFSIHELEGIERLLQDLKYYMALFIFDLAQHNPGALKLLKQPISAAD